METRYSDTGIREIGVGSLTLLVIARQEDINAEHLILLSSFPSFFSQVCRVCGEAG